MASSNPKINDDDLREIALTLVKQLDTVDASLSGLYQRWAVNEAFYANRPVDAVVADDVNDSGEVTLRFFAGKETQFPSQIHAPLVQPIVDSLADNVANTVLGQSNYCTGTTFGEHSSESNTITDEMQWHFSNARVDEKVQQWARGLFTINMAVCRVRFNYTASDFLPNTIRGDVALDGPIEFAGLEIDSIHPRDFKAYPTDATDISQCRTLAHRWRKMHVDEIDEMIQTGAWLKIEASDLVDSYQTDENLSPEEKTFNLVSPSRVDGDRFVTLYEGLTKYKPKGAKCACWYKFLLAKETYSLLQFEPYEFTKPWYFTFYHDRPVNSIYPSNSVAQNIQSLQQVKNEVYSQLVDGAMAALYPVFLTKDSGLFSEQVTDWRPGMIIPVVGDNLAESIHPLPLGLNPEPLMALLQYVDQFAERTARTSSNDMATSFNGSMTATEAAQIAGGSAVKKNAMLTAFANTFSEMWGFGQLLIGKNYPLIQQTYGESSPMSGMEDAQEIMLTPTRWEVTGKNAASTKQQQFAMANQLLGIGMQLAQQGLPAFDLERIIKMVVSASELPGASGILTTDEHRRKIIEAGAGGVSGDQPGIPTDQGLPGQESPLLQGGNGDTMPA